MNRLVSLIGLISLLSMLSGCSIFEVMDDLYDIDVEQGRLSLRVCYSECSDDVSTSLPTSYRLRVVSETEYKNGTITFTSLKDSAKFTNKMNRSIDTLSFEGHVQPGTYRFYSYNESSDYDVSNSAIKVKTTGESIVSNPKPLFLGFWQHEISKGEQVNAEVVVRQRTRSLHFRFLLNMADTLNYISSEVVLSNVCYQINLLSGSVDTYHRVDLPLHMTSGTYIEGDKTYLCIEDHVNIMSPSAEEYSTLGLDNTLTVVVKYATPSEQKQAAFSFERVLDDAYSQSYVGTANDPYCINQYTWQTTLTINN